MSQLNPDTVSIDAVIKALYESISGFAGEPRQWERDRALYAPGALLIPMRPPTDSTASAEILTFDGYVKSRTPFFATQSFFEVEIARKEFHFGSMAHVLSAYEGRDAPNGKILKRGVNSLQLFYDEKGARWWVASIMWDNERDGVNLPAELRA